MTTMDWPLRIAITCGEPAGIGAEVVLRALLPPSRPDAEILLVGPEAVWRQNARLVTGDEALPFPVVEPDLSDLEGQPDFNSQPSWRWGELSPWSAHAASRAVETAVKLALAGEVDGVVTAPLTKEGLRLSCCDHPGHTEWLGQLCREATGRGAKRRKATPSMMFTAPDLKVILVTTHMPLAEVAPAISRETVEATIEACRDGMIDDFGLAAPRIGVCALNPHAGEKGLLGDEEARHIAPAVEAARARGWEVTGPVPADVVFHQALSGGFDAVVAMYHDQGLGPFKLLHFHDGVNVTLGLPIVRTSPDHGTALEIAGTGAARPDSMAAALRTALEIAGRRKGLAS